MKDIIVRIRERNRRGTWKETHKIRDNQDPQKFAEALVNQYNTTLNEGEIERVLVSFEVLEEPPEPIKYAHMWRQTNTNGPIMCGAVVYDTYRCTRCGITGKRVGERDFIKRDPKYKSPVYETCASAARHLNAKREKRKKNRK